MINLVILLPTCGKGLAISSNLRREGAFPGYFTVRNSLASWLFFYIPENKY